MDSRTMEEEDGGKGDCWREAGLHRVQGVSQYSLPSASPDAGKVVPPERPGARWSESEHHFLLKMALQDLYISYK